MPKKQVRQLVRQGRELHVRAVVVVDVHPIKGGLLTIGHPPDEADGSRLLVSRIDQTPLDAFLAHQGHEESDLMFVDVALREEGSHILG